MDVDSDIAADRRSSKLRCTYMKTQLALLTTAIRNRVAEETFPEAAIAECKQSLILQ